MSTDSQHPTAAAALAPLGCPRLPLEVALDLIDHELRRLHRATYLPHRATLIDHQLDLRLAYTQ